MSTNDFSQYLRRRGFEPPWNSAASLRRWFLTSFTQPGFARFWRLWNPPIGFLLFQLYQKFGGDKNRIFACLGTFAVCGAFHDIIVLIVRREHALEPQWTIAFLIFGIMVLLTSHRAFLKAMRKVPWPIHVALNATCLYAGIMGADFVCGVFQL